MKLLRFFVALGCLVVAGVGTAAAAHQWQRLHGQVQSVDGNTVTFKTDDGRVLTVDATLVSSDIRGALEPNEGATLVGYAGASATQFTAQYIQQDSSNRSRGGPVARQPPATQSSMK